jgi:hypothetical protein
MKRYQLFEFTDLSWLPGVFRRLVTDYLRALMELRQPFSPKASLICRAIEAATQPTVVDLCSGSSGPWISLAPKVRAHLGQEISVTLTDKFPDFREEEGRNDYEWLRFCHEPVDATAVPPYLEGVRTLFNGFHHFPPGVALSILRDSVRGHQPIVVFEMLQRTWSEMIYTSMAPIAILLLTPVLKPREVSRYIWTYLIPIAPIMVLWDGLVSVLRCYTPSELLDMASKAAGESYVWESGYFRHNGLPVTYLVGYPRAEPRERPPEKV